MLDLAQDGPRKDSIRMLGLHLGYGNPEIETNVRDCYSVSCTESKCKMSWYEIALV